MAFDWNNVVAPAFTLLGSLGGGFTGWWLKRKSDKDTFEATEKAEARKWRRDQLLVAYSDFQAAMDVFTNRASHLDRTDYTAETAEKAQEELRALFVPITVATSRLVFLSPRPIALMASEIEMLAIEASAFVTAPEPMQGTLHGQRAWLTLGRWLGVWIGAARSDLAGHPVNRVPSDLPTTPRWKQGEGWLDPAMRDAD